MQYLIALILACITIYLGSPVVGLLLGIGFSIVFLTDNEFITRKYATRLLQTGIILLGSRLILVLPKKPVQAICYQFLCLLFLFFY